MTSLTALAHATAPPPAFNHDFYVTAATVIPVPDLRREPCAFVLNAAVRGDLVGDGAGVAGHGGRGGVDLVDEQGQGAGDAL